MTVSVCFQENFVRNFNNETSQINRSAQFVRISHRNYSEMINQLRVISTQN